MRSWLTLNPNSGIYLPYASSLALWSQVLSSCKTQELYYNTFGYYGLLRICEFERLFYQCDIQLHTKLRSLRQYYPGTNFQTLRAWFLPKCQESYLWVWHFSGRQRSHQKLWPVTKFYLHVNCAPNKVEIILCEEWKWAEPSNSLFFFFLSGEGEIILSSRNKTLQGSQWQPTSALLSVWIMEGRTITGGRWLWYYQRPRISFEQCPKPRRQSLLFE